MVYKNYTPHTIKIYDPTGSRVLLELPSEGQIRAEEKVEEGSFIFDTEYALEIPVVEKQYTVGDLPETNDGDVIIVAFIVLNAMKETGLDTAQFYAPDTGPDSAIRDGEGRILGVKRLQQVPAE